MTDRGTMGAGTNGALGTYKNSATAVNGLKCVIPSNDRYVRVPALSDYQSNRLALQSASGSGGNVNTVTMSRFSPSAVNGFAVIGTPNGNQDLSLSVTSTDGETWAKHARVNYIIKF